MKLILVRHAAALDRGIGLADERRYLTPAGRAYFRKTARTMRAQGVAPDLILTSSPLQGRSDGRHPGGTVEVCRGTGRSGRT